MVKTLNIHFKDTGIEIANNNHTSLTAVFLSQSSFVANNLLFLKSVLNLDANGMPPTQIQRTFFFFLVIQYNSTMMQIR